MDLSKIISKTFMWMFVGLAVTFLTGSVVSNNPSVVEEVFKGGTIIIAAIVEIALVIFLSARIHKMNPMTAKIMFILYSFVSGLTFSSIFIVYKISEIIVVFLITAVIMLVMALIGYFTKIDFTKIGTYLLIMLLGIVVVSIINIFVGNEGLSLAVAIAAVVIFIIYIAYDIQKVKQLYEDDILEEDNLAIYGALQLYLDFINIFIDLLRIFYDNK